MATFLDHVRIKMTTLLVMVLDTTVHKIDTDIDQLTFKAWATIAILKMVKDAMNTQEAAATEDMAGLRIRL